MALGAFTIIDKAAAQGPVFSIKATLVGDGAYPAGGSAGLLAKLKTALNVAGIDILDVRDITGPDVALSRLEYDHTNEKLFARVKTTGVESADADQSDHTYVLFITAK